MQEPEHIVTHEATPVGALDVPEWLWRNAEIAFDHVSSGTKLVVRVTTLDDLRLDYVLERTPAGWRRMCVESDLMDHSYFNWDPTLIDLSHAAPLD